MRTARPRHPHAAAAPSPGRGARGPVGVWPSRPGSGGARPKEPPLVATVRRGTLTARLTTSGSLRPVQSITYRSPLAGREAEIIDLAPEGHACQRRGSAGARSTPPSCSATSSASAGAAAAEMDLQVAEGERQEADGRGDAVSRGRRRVERRGGARHDSSSREKKRRAAAPGIRAAEAAARERVHHPRRAERRPAMRSKQPRRSSS